MKIIITEDKSSNMMSKLHNLKTIAVDLLECFEECKEGSSKREHLYDDYDEYDKYSSRRKSRRDYDDDEDEDYDDYKHSSRKSFRGSRY